MESCGKGGKSRQPIFMLYEKKPEGIVFRLLALIGTELPVGIYGFFSGS